MVRINMIDTLIVFDYYFILCVWMYSVHLVCAWCLKMSEGETESPRARVTTMVVLKIELGSCERIASALNHQDTSLATISWFLRQNLTF